MPLATWADHGVALVARHPIVRVRLTDRQPTTNQRGHYFFCGPLFGPESMPRDLGPDETTWLVPDELVPDGTFATSKAADRALGLKALNAARESAGLPPVEDFDLTAW